MGNYDFNQSAVTALFGAVTDVARNSSAFSRVNGHEPKNAPGAQLACSIWLSGIGPTGKFSGLNKVTGVVTFTARIVKSILGANANEDDAIEIQCAVVTGQLMAAYSAGFTLGGSVYAIDLLGMAGTALGAKALYFEQDTKYYRGSELTIPVIVSDMWVEAA
jgi:hypothetical protein